METEITLVKAVFGMGNPNHAHVHRYNTVNLGNEAIDKLKLDQLNGGVTMNTLAEESMRAGGLSIQPEGYVNIEEGFNLRRGVAMLKFIVNSGALSEVELTGLFYLHGGSFSEDGISSDTKMVPVRFWEIDRRSVVDPTTGYPLSTSKLSTSNQLLLGDPELTKDLRALRPLDLGEMSTGYLAVEDDWSGAEFNGTISGRLNNNPTVSKTDNLDPSYFARQAMKLAITSSDDLSGDITHSLANSLSDPSLRESTVSENYFMQAMQSASGVWSLNGFDGYTVGEVHDAFINFPDVLNINLLNETNFAATDNLLLSSEYGTANIVEVMSTEVAMITTNLLTKCELTMLDFAATNNPNDTNSVLGSETGVQFITGQVMSIHDEDPNVINKVEKFKALFINTFFGKYTGGTLGNTTIVNVSVSANVFGETSVTLYVNGDVNTSKTFVNATYAIGRTSSNIASSDASTGSLEGFVTNLKEFFQD